MKEKELQASTSDYPKIDLKEKKKAINYLNNL
jgi:hypothetical protein